MKVFTFVPFAALLVAALPTSERDAVVDLAERQYGLDINELEKGACRSVTFIFARGTFEVGNMVSTLPFQHPDIHT